MLTLILPVAGKSSRFPGMRPKWLLTLPDGKLMFEKAIEQLGLKNIKKIVLICLKEHTQQYIPISSINSILKRFNKEFEIVILSRPTSSPAETVYKGLKKANIKGNFFVKDCDNFFSYSPRQGNNVAVININKTGLIDAKNKSYVSYNKIGIINNIIEKEVISNTFCVGGYGFEDSNIFYKHFLKLKKIEKKEIYLSHIIYSMILEKRVFKIAEVDNYVDLGTKDDYLAYLDSFVTIFCDVDGVLLENGSKFGKNGWRTKPILQNLEILEKLSKTKKIFLVITTSRHKSELNYLEKIFVNNNIDVHRYIFDLPHCKRIIINDYSSSLPYPSSLSINLERDSKNLSQVLGSLLKI